MKRESGQVKKCRNASEFVLSNVIGFMFLLLLCLFIHLFVVAPAKKQNKKQQQQHYSIIVFQDK